MSGTDDAPVGPVIAAAHGEWLRDRNGREYIDLCMGYGSVWLGHNHPTVSAALAAQLASYAAPGFLPTQAVADAADALHAILPETHFLGGLYSTGMEAVETALRAAWAHTGRTGIAGFEGSTHGRSFLTAAIGGSAPKEMPGFVHTLPAFSADQERLASELEALATRSPLAAIVIEPIQMTGGGHEIGRALCERLFALARAKGIAVVFDETLTGLYRCGERFYFDLLEQVPDILVLGKGLANGFPCAAVALRKGFAWDRVRVRPGSTYWNHPLASAAVAATLAALRSIDARRKVGEIESVIRSALGGLELRGRGAMWCVGSPQPGHQLRLAQRILEAGVVVSYYDRFLRLLPPLGIELDTLARACETIRKAHADTLG